MTSDNNSNNNFKLETVKELGKLQAAIEIGQEKVANKLELIMIEVEELKKVVGNIKQPCENFTQHLEYHKKNEGNFGIIKWVRDKPMRALIVILVIAGQLGLSIDKLVELIKQIIKL